MTCTEALTTVNPASPHPGEHLGQQRRPGRGGPARIVGAEDRPEVTQPGRAEQRVAQCVRGDVTVGVPGAAVDAGRTADPAIQHVPAGLDRMHVDPGAHPEGRRRDRRLGDIRRSASSRSAGVVILNAARSPGTVPIATPKRLDQAGVVGGRLTPGCGGRVRPAQQRRVEALRRLHHPQLVAVQGAGQRAVLPDAADGVDDRQHRDDGGLPGPDGRDDGRDHRRPARRPGPRRAPG